MKKLLSVGALALAAVLIPAASASADSPGHILPKNSPEAVYTTGQVGSLVRFGHLHVSQHGEDWDMSNFANAFGAGSFFWAPGGRQTDDYLHVTAAGATLVAGGQNGTIFAPVTDGSYTVLATLGSHGPSRNVLTDVSGRLVIAAESASGPSTAQLWVIR